jgi:hypothetical protein
MSVVDGSLEDWTSESHYDGQRRGRYDGDSTSLVLDFEEFDDSRFLKTFDLRPGQRYIARVHAEGTAIEPQNGGDVGANLCVFGTWSHSHEFAKGTGTFSGDLHVEFRPPRDGRVTLGLRLGFWGSEARGRVVFSRFRVEIDDDWVTYGSGQVRIDLRLDDVDRLVDPALIVRFTERMSAVYFAMAQLYGREPFDGVPVFYEPHNDIDAWAYAGNPIAWNRQCCLDYFHSLRTGDDACFGAIHEMGHNFEQTRLSHINHEMIANFALCYAVENLGMPILFDGELTVGRGLQDGFYRRSYEASIAKRSYNHDGVLYCILRVKDAIGWKPFEVVLRKLGNEKKKEKLPPAETFDLWMRMLTEEAGKDVKTTFIGDEYLFIISQSNM